MYLYEKAHAYIYIGLSFHIILLSHMINSSDADDMATQ